VAKRTIVVAISKKHKFKEWQRKAVTNNLYPLFAKILEDNVFKGLICPFTAELPLFPMKTPCNHIYEKADLEQWLKTKNPSALCCV
jgi:hypothetical protein